MQYTLEVTGMTCGHCERAVTQAVQGIDNTAQVQIDRAINQVIIHSSASEADLVRVIAEEGYQVQAKS